jgi:hypothetical protein
MTVLADHVCACVCCVCLIDYTNAAWNTKFIKWLIAWVKNAKQTEEALRAAAGRILVRAAFPEERIPTLRKQLQTSDTIPALIELAKLGRVPSVKAINLADVTILEHLDTGMIQVQRFLVALIVVGGVPAVS